MRIKPLIAAAALSIMLAGCNNADAVNFKVKSNAFNFSVSRRVTVINTRLGTQVYEQQGLIFLTVSEDGKRLDLLIKVSDDVYKKEIVMLNEDTMYILQDLEGTKIEQ